MLEVVPGILFLFWPEQRREQPATHGFIVEIRGFTFLESPALAARPRSADLA
mgnify:CR=1 FL=1